LARRSAGKLRAVARSLSRGRTLQVPPLSANPPCHTAVMQLNVRCTTAGTPWARSAGETAILIGCFPRAADDDDGIVLGKSIPWGSRRRRPRVPAQRINGSPERKRTVWLYASEHATRPGALTVATPGKVSRRPRSGRERTFWPSLPSGTRARTTRPSPQHGASRKMSSAAVSGCSLGHSHLRRP
jgi:hypothetical protein